MTDLPLVATRTFIHATRDAGYRGAPQAVAELVDNAVQAGATRVDIGVEARDDGVEISVLDDGCGMDAGSLAAALQFGGSTRFDDRAGMGRFGMGLPNSSLSQARRLEVYSWRGGGPPLRAHIDVDEIAAGDVAGVSRPEPGSLPALDPLPTESGTLVLWRRCDRLSDRKVRALRTELRTTLGGMFRHYIWDGLRLAVSGEACEGIDPLMLHPLSPSHGASALGDPMRLELRAPSGAVGTVTVRFSELPVHAWHGLSHSVKRRMGITRGGGVYVVRARREIDRGWLFMGEKRRENYDDWWRAEIAFEPDLDEAFGITNTKQQIRPAPWLVEAITPELEGVARALNARVRRAHETLKARERFAPSEATASGVEARLPPLQYPDSAPSTHLADRLGTLFPDLFREPPTPDVRIVEDDLGEGGLFQSLLAPRRMIVVLNTAHPYYRCAYAPLAEATDQASVERRTNLELLLVALARADATSDEPAAARERHAGWSDVLAELVRS